jgi:hypothetical protein
MKHNIQIIITGMLLLFASVSQATTLTYILDQSKTFEDGIDYLSVTLTDDNPAGQLNVSVEILPALAGLLDEGGGIEAFGFSVVETVELGGHRPHHWNLWPEREHEHGRGAWCNHIERHGDDYEGGEHHGEGKHHGDMDALTYGDFELPEGWKVSIGKPHREMLEHDVLVYGSRKNTQDPLLLSIAGLTVEDLIGEFTVLVSGLSGEEHCEGGKDGRERECGRHRMSALFYGGRLEDPVVVPIPAAMWLMGSGLLGLVGVARRRRQSSNGTGF